VRVALAGPEHERALRALVTQDAMPGWIRMAYGREPDFFQGLAVEGPFTQAFVYLDAQGGVHGMGTRAVKPAWIDGEPAHLGYLGGLRVSPEVRGGLGLARGFRMLRELHGDGRCPLYVTTITADNEHAQRILTSGRAGLPRYLCAGRLCFRAVAPSWLARRLRPAAGLRVVGGEELGLEALLAFLSRHGPRRQLFPRLEAAHFGSPYLRGLAVEDFLVVLDGSGEPAGVAALWDQSAYKQLLITGYAPVLRHALPLLRPLARWRTGLRLPRAGEELRVVYLSFPCFREDDPLLLRAILAAAGQRLEGRHRDCLLMAFTQNDPLRPDDIAGVSYESLVYLACYEEAEPRGRAIIDGSRPLYIEPASI
jgi:hypothetical protein